MNEGNDWIKMKIGLQEHDDGLMKVTDIVINPKNPNMHM